MTVQLEPDSQHVMREQLFAKNVLVYSGGCYVFVALGHDLGHWDIHFGHFAVPLLVVLCVMTVAKMIHTWRESVTIRAVLQEDGYRIPLLLLLLPLAIITIVVSSSDLVYHGAIILYLLICLIDMLWATRVVQRRIKKQEAKKQEV